MAGRKRIPTNCSKCGILIGDISGITAHERQCGLDTRIRKARKKRKTEYVDDEKILCYFGCGLKAKIKFKNGKYCCSISANSCFKNKEKNSIQVSKALTGKPYKEGRVSNRMGTIPWNKGLNKETSEKVLQSSLKSGASLKGKPAHIWSDEQRKSQSIRMTGITGGYHHGSGGGISGEFKGFKCDSSWELAYILYSIDHGVELEKNIQKFPYKFKNKSLSYIPDFILKNGDFVEIKGHDTDKTNAKHAHFPHKLIILRSEEMKPILKYVRSKYGKDFVRLYEK